MTTVSSRARILATMGNANFGQLVTNGCCKLTATVTLPFLTIHQRQHRVHALMLSCGMEQVQQRVTASKIQMVR